MRKSAQTKPVAVSDPQVTGGALASRAAGTAAGARAKNVKEQIDATGGNLSGAAKQVPVSTAPPNQVALTSDSREHDLSKKLTGRTADGKPAHGFKPGSLVRYGQDGSFSLMDSPDQAEHEVGRRYVKYQGYYLPVSKIPVMTEEQRKMFEASPEMNSEDMDRLAVERGFDNWKHQLQYARAGRQRLIDRAMAADRASRWFS